MGISADRWDLDYAAKAARQEGHFVADWGTPPRKTYLAPPSVWADGGDRRLKRLCYDPHPASLALCSFLESQTRRLKARAATGQKIIAAMKDMGIVSVLTAGLENVACFYADLVYLEPCLSEDPRFLSHAAALGFGDDFCDIRALLGAFAEGDYWPQPDLCLAAVGACCDDFSACAQELPRLKLPTHFWELPAIGESPTTSDIAFVMRELKALCQAIEQATGQPLDEAALARGIQETNRLRALIREARRLTYARDAAPLPALESLLFEALAIDFGSDLEAATQLLEALVTLLKDRRTRKINVVPADNIRLFWITPAMDPCLQNLMEQWGGRLAGTEYMIGHSFQEISENLPPLEALARNVLENPMIGSTERRAKLIQEEANAFDPEGFVLVSFFGASHCPFESRLFAETLQEQTGKPLLRLDAQSSFQEFPASARSRLESFIETLAARRPLSTLKPIHPFSGEKKPMSCSSKKSCCEKQNCSASPSSEPMPIFRRMENLIEEELAFVEVEKQRGRKLVGIYCEYTPRELILAADAIPVCLCGFDQEMATAAESRLPTNLCPLIKSSFGYIETHSCPFFEQADAIVAETTCDGKKKMYELIAERHPTFVLELTQKPDEARAFAHWLEEVRALKIFLEKTLETTITNAALSEAIRKMNRRRERLLKIAEYAQGPEIYIRGLENLLLHFRLADAGMEEECLTAVEAELERRHKAKETVAPKNAPRILITGVPVGHDVAKVFRLVEECGAAVVVQESCTGLKPLYENVAETGDPLEAIARKYFHLPCSCFTPNAERFHLLDKLTADFKVDGVIDLIWQACHTYNVESTRVREWAAGKHLPFLKIETDYSPSDTERLKTRIETFLELIR